MRKRIYSIIMVIVMAAMLLAGCSSGPKPEETVSKFLDAAKEFDTETMNSCVKDSDWEGEDEEYIEDESLKKYFTTALSKMTYTLEDSKVDKDKATVPAKIKYYDGTELAGEVIGEYLTKLMGTVFTGDEMSEEEANKLLGDMFEEKSKELEDKYSNAEIQFKCVKEDGKWLITDMDEKMLEVLTSNFSQVMEEMDKSLEALDESAADGVVE